VTLHSGLSQEERLESVRAFRAHEKDVLVATDVASKGELNVFASCLCFLVYDRREIRRIGLCRCPARCQFRPPERN